MPRISTTPAPRCAPKLRGPPPQYSVTIQWGCSAHALRLPAAYSQRAQNCTAKARARVGAEGRSVGRGARRGPSSERDLAGEQKDAEIASGAWSRARFVGKEGLEAAFGLGFGRAGKAGHASLTRWVCLAAFAGACEGGENWILAGLGCAVRARARVGRARTCCVGAF